MSGALDPVFAALLTFNAADILWRTAKRCPTPTPKEKADKAVFVIAWCALIWDRS